MRMKLVSESIAIKGEIGIVEVKRRHIVHSERKSQAETSTTSKTSWLDR